MLSEYEEKKRLVKYPVKIGFGDGSGKDENYITDALDGVIVAGWGDCCKLGGIRNRNVVLVILRTLNKTKPKFYIREIVKKQPTQKHPNKIKLHDGKKHKKKWEAIK